MPAIKYNAGDFVVVNEDVQEGCNYGDCYVTRQMANLAGCVVQITSCPKENTYTVDETDEWGYVWTGKCFLALREGNNMLWATWFMSERIFAKAEIIVCLTRRES